MPTELPTGLQAVAVDDLHPHRLHRARPAGELDSELMESIKADGILTPLDVLADGSIVGGKRRWEAARALGLVAVPCRVIAVPAGGVADLFRTYPDLYSLSADPRRPPPPN